VTARRGTSRRLALVAGVLACTAMVSGCQFGGAGSLPLPFTAGTGAGSWTVTAIMGQIGNLPVNAQVMVNDVAVGTVTAIRFDHWHARLTISLPGSVRLPANATATIGQKSLFGAEYVALGPPAGAPATGRLRAGDVIPLSRTSVYPSTEDVLAVLSTVLNGGGLNQLSTITTELNDALRGHQRQARALLRELRTFAASLDSQRAAIVRTLAALDELSGQLWAGDKTLARAIDRIPAGLAVLDGEEKNLTAALTATSRLSTVAIRVVTRNRRNLLANLRNLRPALRRLADSRQNLVDSLAVLTTFPFPGVTVDHSFQGDYANLYLSLDLTAGELQKAWLTGTPAGALPQLGSSPEPRTPLPLPGGAGGTPAGPPQSPGGLLSFLLGGGKG
jgi:phospholipid/cholesterol/gamma-HCH transport system substrate-binding protein